MYQSKTEKFSIKKLRVIFLAIVPSLLLYSEACLPTVFEDAEHANTLNWSVFDNTPSGAIIQNIVDPDLDSRVIELIGTTTQNGFQIGSYENDTGWLYERGWNFDFDMKTSAAFHLYISITTSMGHRHVALSNSDSEPFVEHIYLRKGLGQISKNGMWQHHAVNLKNIVTSLEPGNEILRVNGVLFRGNARIDNLELGADSVEGDEVINTALDEYTDETVPTVTSPPPPQLEVVQTATESVVTAPDPVGDLQVDLVRPVISTCSVIQNSDCRGPSQSVGEFKVIEKNLYPAEAVVDLQVVGVDTSGVEDSSDAIQLAADTGKILYFPPGKYRIEKPISITNGIYGNGHIISSDKYIFIGKNDKLFVNGLTIEGSDRSAGATPIALYVENYDDVSLLNNHFVNTSVIHKNSELQRHSGLVVKNNRFNIDYSFISEHVVQNDLITVRGIDGVSVESNDIQAINPNRIIKIADTTGSNYPLSGAGAKVSPYNSKNILIENNRIVARTSSNKQVMDLFHGTENISIGNNYIDAHGFTSVVENKTTIGTTFTQNTKIINNIITTSGTAVSFQGSWGAQTAGHQSGYQNILVDNNYIEGTSDFNQPKTGLIGVRFFNEAIVQNNELYFSTKSPKVAATFSSNDEAYFRDNYVDSGVVRFSKAIRNTKGDYFDGKESVIRAENNVLNDAFAEALSSLDFRGIGSSSAKAFVLNNSISQKTASTGEAPISIVNSTFGQFVVQRNEMSFLEETEPSIYVQGSEFGSELTQNDNIWK